MKRLRQLLADVPLPIYGALCGVVIALLQWSQYPSWTIFQAALTAVFYSAVSALYTYVFVTTRRQTKAFFYEVKEDQGSLTVREALAPLTTQFRFRAMTMRQKASFTMLLLVVSSAALLTHGFLSETSFRQSYVDGVYGEMSTIKDSLQKLVADVNRPDLERRVREASEALSLASREADKQRIFIAQMIGRASLVAVLIFMMRFLVNLYGYQLRLAARYDEKADILLLQSHAGIEKAIQIARIDGELFTGGPGKPLFQQSAIRKAPTDSAQTLSSPTD